MSVNGGCSCRRHWSLYRDKVCKSALLFFVVLLTSNIIWAKNTEEGKKLNEKQPLVCAIVEVLDCGEHQQCESVNPELVNLPDLFTINFKKQRLEGAGRETPFNSVNNGDTNLIIQGVTKNGRGWSLVLSKGSGEMTGAVADIDYGFLIFGSCQRR